MPMDVAGACARWRRSWLSHLRHANDVSAQMLARVIDYTVKGRTRDNPPSTGCSPRCLIPSEAAAELAAAYAQRWEIESVFDELETHQRGPRVVLRAMSPDLVLQEIWDICALHYAIRSVMAQAAQHSGHDPDRVSFTAALGIVRQYVAQQVNHRRR